MARPSKKSERTEEIMQAFRRCVARYGLEGSTLERIAEESGLQRSLVRHYVGNREDLTLQLIEQMAAQYDREWREMLSDLPATEVAPAFLRMLFEYEDDDRERMQLESALIFAASRDAAISEAMRSWTERFYGDIAEILRRDYPDTDGDALQSVAFGIASLYFNIDSMQPLQMADRYRASALDAARRLVATLA